MPEAERQFNATRLRDDASPLDYMAFFLALGSAWIKIGVLFNLAWLGISVALYTLHIVGRHSYSTGLAFITAFCVTGAGDALWRSMLASSAKKQWEKAGRTFNPDILKLMKTARFNDLTLLIQFVVAGSFAIHLAQ
jgi:hypothetical protein